MYQQGNAEITVAGHICLDVSPDFSAIQRDRLSDILTPGKLINIGAAQMSVGGVVSNTGVSLTKLGIQTALTAKLGCDEFGDIILSILNKTGANVEIKTIEGESTSYSIVLNIPGFDRIFLHNPGANNTYTADDIDFDQVSRSKLFHFGYPTLMKTMYENDGEELVKIFRKTKEAGVITSLDMALPDAASPAGKADYKKIFQKLLPYVDIFVPSLEETVLMLDREEYMRIVEKADGHDFVKTADLTILPRLGQTLIDMGVKVLVIKCGSKGYYLKTAGEDSISKIGLDSSSFANRELFEETFHVENIKSTTGAGDVSIAAFLASIIRGYGIEDCAREACATASLTIQKSDVFSGIRPLEETLEIVKTWERDPVSLPDGWSYEPNEKIWFSTEDSKYTK